MVGLREARNSSSNCWKPWNSVPLFSVRLLIVKVPRLIFLASAKFTSAAWRAGNSMIRTLGEIRRLVARYG